MPFLFAFSTYVNAIVVGVGGEAALAPASSSTLKIASCSLRAGLDSGVLFVDFGARLKQQLR